MTTLTEKTKARMSLEIGSMIGGVVSLLFLLSSGVGHYIETSNNQAAQIAQIIKVQATHETRIDAFQHENDIQDANNLRFQDQINQQLIRIQDQFHASFSQINESINKLRDTMRKQ